MYTGTSVLLCSSLFAT